MTPPEAPANGHSDRAEANALAVFAALQVLRVRADFLSAAQGLRRGTTGFLLQARERKAGEAAPGLIRVGYTASKKIGNAVIRNRAKRRLREIARALLPLHARPGWDYVLVARPEAAVSRDFDALKADLIRALGLLHHATADRETEARP